MKSQLEPLLIQPSFTVEEMLDRVLRLPAVASKRYLTNKVVIKLEGFDNKPITSGDNALTSILFCFVCILKLFTIQQVGQ